MGSIGIEEQWLTCTLKRCWYYWTCVLGKNSIRLCLVIVISHVFLINEYIKPPLKSPLPTPPGPVFINYTFSCSQVAHLIEGVGVAVFILSNICYTQYFLLMANFFIQMKYKKRELLKVLLFIMLWWKPVLQVVVPT